MAVQTNAYGILSDEQGFGIGTVVADIRLQNQVLEDIRHTVSAIHQLLRHPHSQANSVINSTPAITPSVINSIPAVTPSVINSIPVVTPNPLRDYPRPRERDTSGRFISNRVATPVIRRERGANGQFTSGDTDNNTFLSRLIDGVRQGYVEAQNDLTDIDPAVAAAQEIAAPLGRTYDVLLGGGRSETVWYKRIWRELRTQSGFHRAELRTLNDIENRPLAVNTNGDSGLLGLIKALPAAIGGLIKAAIKKVPFAAAGLGAVSSFLGINETENDPTLSRAGKDAQNGKNIGGVTGSVAGMWAGGRLGAALGSFAGPIGAGVGGLLGAGAGYLAGDELGKVWGEHVGTYFNEMRNSDLAGYMKQAWDTDMQFLRDVISTLQNAVNAVTGWIDNVTGKIKDAAAPVIENVKENAAWINNAVKDSTGFDVSKAADSVMNTAKSAADTVKSGAGRVWDDFKIAGSSLAGKTSEIASKAGDSSLVRGFKATASKDDFIKQIYPAAKRSADATGIPVDAVIGQAALESNWGRNAPEGSNNLFGIKAGSKWQGKTVDTTTHEVINGKRIKIKAPFRAYDSLDDSIADHSKFLNNKRYQAAKNAQNAEEYFTALKAGGYATDPNYVRSGTAVANNVHSRIEALGLNKANVVAMPKAVSNKASVASIPTAKVPALPAMVKAPEQPQIVEKINTNRESDKQTTVQNSTPLASPLLSDLRIAHIARGGIGLL